MTELHVLVRGRVQGVGFRWFVRERGQQLGLRGWVRNRSDGTVEVAAVGGADDVDAFRQSLTNGPPGADVREVVDLPPTTDAYPKEFTIVR
jgi:acylphosphatase